MAASEKARRATFWLTVAGVAILANFGLELVSQRFPGIPGLKTFTAFTHCGPTGSAPNGSN